MEPLDKQNFISKKSNKKYKLAETTFFGAIYIIDIIFLLIFILLGISICFLPIQWWAILTIDLSILFFLLILIKPIGEYKVYERIICFFKFKLRGSSIDINLESKNEIWYEISQGVNLNILSDEEINTLFQELTSFTNNIKSQFKIIKTHSPISIKENIEYLSSVCKKIEKWKENDKDIKRYFKLTALDVFKASELETKIDISPSLFLVFNEEKIKKSSIEKHLNDLPIKWREANSKEIKLAKVSVFGKEIEWKEKSRECISNNKKMLTSKFKFGSNVMPNFLFNLFFDENTSFSLDVNFFDYDQEEKAKKRLLKTAKTDKKISNFIDEIKKQDEDTAKEGLAIDTILNGNSIVSFNGFMTFVGERKTVNIAYKKLSEKISAIENIKLEKVAYKQYDYLKSMLSFEKSNEYSHITSASTIGSSWPFQTASLQDKKGVNLATTLTNHPWIWNSFSLENKGVWHSFISGKTRSGKTVLAQLIAITNLVIKDSKVVILDPHNQYGDIFEKMGAKIIDVGNLKFNIISLLNVTKDNFDKKVQIQSGIFREAMYILFKRELVIDNTARLIDELSNEIIEFYNKKKENVLKGEVFVLSDLNNWLITQKRGEKYEIIINRFLKGSYKIFNYPQQWDIENKKIIIFNTKGLKELSNNELIETINMLIFKSVSDFCLNPENDENNKVSLFIDEAHLFLKDKTNLKTLTELMRESRKYWVNITIITQMITDLLSSNSDDNDLVTIFEQMGNRFYGNIDAFEIDTLNKILILTGSRALTKNEINHLRRGEGSFLWTTDRDERLAIKVDLNKLPYIVNEILPKKQSQSGKEY